MSALLTIVIPTHNRHHYLPRVFEYYKDWKYPVIVLDSTLLPYQVKDNLFFRYIHLPQMPLPDKLLHGFSKADSKFIAMCADDDFLVQDGIDSGIQFLLQNPNFSVADGGILFYKKKDVKNNKLIFNLIYKTGLNQTFDIENPLERLLAFFKKYRSVFYGIHYRKNLIFTYQNCKQSFRNLYLNEYLVALIPIGIGYCKILPELIAVREFTDDSDDKTTINLNNMFGNATNEKELFRYIDCVADALSTIIGLPFLDCKMTIDEILRHYSTVIFNDINITQKRLPLSKRAGNLIGKLPFAGHHIIRYRRSLMSKKEISALIKTQKDKANVECIEKIINKFKFA